MRKDGDVGDSLSGGGSVWFVGLEVGGFGGTHTSIACVSFFRGGPGHSGSRAASSGERDTEHLPIGMDESVHSFKHAIFATTRRRSLLL
jgi:hypothetical protein